jgi:hypothetical protein
VPAGVILRHSASWVGLIVVIALRGVVVGHTARIRLTCAAVACAVALAPLEQARLHTQTSLDKHVAFGAWFGAIAAGYVLAYAWETSKYSGWRIPALTLGIIALIGFPEAASFYESWPNSTAAVGVVQRLMAADPTGRILAEQGPVMDYYLRLPPFQLTDDAGAFRYRVPLQHKIVGGTAAYLEAIRNHYFSVIELDFSFSGRLHTDKKILAALQSTGGYHLVSTIPWSDRFGKSTFMIWKYE